MTFAETTLKEYIGQAAGSSPTPGGGSVAAVAGALAASMASMVANLTLGKEKYAVVDGEMRQIAERGSQLIQALLLAADEDARAYQKVMDAYQLPKKDETQQSVRSKAIQGSLLEAAQVPLHVAALCRDVIGIAGIVQKKGNPMAVSDAVVAMYLAYAALVSAVVNVDANLNLLEAGARSQQINDEKLAIIQDGKKLMQRADLPY